MKPPRHLNRTGGENSPVLWAGRLNLEGRKSSAQPQNESRALPPTVILPGLAFCFTMEKHRSMGSSGTFHLIKLLNDYLMGANLRCHYEESHSPDGSPTGFLWVATQANRIFLTRPDQGWKRTDHPRSTETGERQSTHTPANAIDSLSSSSQHTSLKEAVSTEPWEGAPGLRGAVCAHPHVHPPATPQPTTVAVSASPLLLPHTPKEEDIILSQPPLSADTHTSVPLQSTRKLCGFSALGEFLPTLREPLGFK